MPETKLNELLKGYMQGFKGLFPKLKDRLSNSKGPKFSKKIINTKRFVASFSVIILIAVAAVYIYISGIAYSVKINGIEIGKIRDEKIAQIAIEKLEQQYKDIAKSEVQLTSAYTTLKTRAGSKEILTEEQLLEAFKGQINYNVETYSIYVNGSSIAVLKQKEDAEAILDSVKEHFLAGVNKDNVKEISFAENVEIKQEFNDMDIIMNKDDIIPFIIKGTDEVKTHKVVAGESFWTISRLYNMSVEELQNANPTINPNKLQINQVLSLIIPKPLISVKTVETMTYTDKIQFEQNVEFSDSLYKDQTNIRVKGQYGEKKVVADVIKINGIEESREILSETVTKEPKTQILVKGTKPIPPKKGTGTFSMPTRGRLTSGFGTRWGRRHEGIDLAASVGTTVSAADGGVVTWVGTSGGYGKLIKIDHGAGFVTYYGHLSKYSVSVGDKVYKGQKIGEVGNTGRSTGPHLHFEIRKNGTPQNPSKYLNK